METRSKKKKKSGEISPPTISPADPNPSDDLSNWSDLPQDLLLPILHLLSSSIPDLFAFAAVCRSWRSLAAAAASAFYGPPLLLTPPHRLSPCHLQTLTDTRSYRCMISSKTLSTRCVGFSHGHLIFISGKKTVIADPFTGREIRSPSFPYCRLLKACIDLGVSAIFSFGFLTAPLANPSSSCLILLSFDERVRNDYCNLLRWRQGSDEWSKLELGRLVPDFRSIVSAAVMDEKVFLLDYYSDLVIVESTQDMSWKRVKARMPREAVLYDRPFFEKHLVECGGEMLLVFLMESGKNEVYRLELAESKWKKKDSLGDWCLFVAKKQVVSCPDPTRWGGRSNCIYFAREGCDAWFVVPLGGGVVRTDCSDDFSRKLGSDLPWSSPFWVYPSKLL